jgi:hypothetical protein
MRFTLPYITHSATVQKQKGIGIAGCTIINGVNKWRIGNAALYAAFSGSNVGL